jgi:hypothetical protein
MRFNYSEQRELRAGRCITRRVRIKATGEELWVEVKRSWDVLYYRIGEGPWERTVTAARGENPQ